MRKLKLKIPPLLVTHRLLYSDKYGREWEIETFKTKHAFAATSLKKFKQAVRALKQAREKILLPVYNKSQISLRYISRMIRYYLWICWATRRRATRSTGGANEQK